MVPNCRSKETTLLKVIKNWLNATFPYKSITVELLKDFLQESENSAIAFQTIDSFGDIVNLLKVNDRWDILPFIIEQDWNFLKNLESKHKVKLVHQLKKKPLYGFDIFYLIIRWGDVELLNILLAESNHTNEELFVSLSKNFKTLTLGNIAISQEIRIKCEEILFKVNFFDKSSNRDRIDFVIELIDGCDCSQQSIFLLTIRTIAENLFVLMKDKKRFQSNFLNQMQFLLALYINKNEGKYALTLSYSARNIANYLKLLKAVLLDSDLDVNLLEEFFAEVGLNRSLASLSKISNYMKIFEEAENDSLVLRYGIERCLQVTGENLKASEMSPNISAELEKTIEETAPEFLKNIRKMRDALSHAEYLRSRLKISDEIYLGLRTELKNIYPKILNVIYMQRFELFKNHLIKNDILIERKISKFSDDYFTLEKLQFCLAPDQFASNERLWNHFCKNIKTSNQKNLLELLMKIIDGIHDVQSIETNLLSTNSETANILTKWFEILIEGNQFNFSKIDKKLSKIDFDPDEIDKVIRAICKKNKLDEQAFDDCLNFSEQIESLIESIVEESGDVGAKFEAIKNLTSIKLFHQNIAQWKNFGEELKLLNFDNFSAKIIEMKSDDNINAIVKTFNGFLIKIYGNKHFRDSKIIISNWLTPKTDDLIGFVRERLNYVNNTNGKSSMHQAALEMCLLDILELNKTQFDSNSMCKTLRNNLAHQNIFFEKPSIELFAKILVDKSKAKIATNPIEYDKKITYKESKESILNQIKLAEIARSGTLEEFKKFSKFADVANNSCFTFATIGDNLEIFQYLANTTKLGLDLKFLAIKNNSGKILNFLTNFNANQGNELHQAILCGQKIIAENYPDLINVFQNSLSPLHLACILGRLEIVQLLLESGADIEARDDKYNTPLHLSALMGHAEITNQLISNKAQIDALGFKDKTALHLAAGNGFNNIVAALLPHTDPNIQDFNGQTPLHLASSFGYNSTIKILLENKAKIDIKDSEGNTPAHLAIIHNQNASTLLLIKPNELQSNKNGNTLLHLAKDCKIAKLLPIEKLANIKNKYNQTPLHCAAIAGNEEMIKLLKSTGAKLNVIDNVLKYPIDYIVEKNAYLKAHFKPINGARNRNDNIFEKLTDEFDGHLVKTKMTSEMIQNSLYYNYFKNVEETLRKLNIQAKPINVNDMLLYETYNGNVAKMDELIANGADLNVKFRDELNLLDVAAFSGNLHLLDRNLLRNLPGVQALLISACNNYLDGIQLLVDNGIQVNATFGDEMVTALHAASEKGHLESIQMLIGMGADVHATDERGSTPLQGATMGGNLETIKILIKNNADINTASSNGSTLLHLAVYNDHLETIKYLLEKQIDINKANKDGSTPLHASAVYGHNEIATLLIEKGCDKNPSDNDGWTPIHEAAFNGRLETIKLLLRKGSNAKKIGKDGWNPLHAAAFNGETKIAMFLLENVCEINACNGNGRTSLYLAAFNGHLDTVEMLLQKGADVNASDNDGWNPLHAASFKGFREIVFLLLEKGGNIYATDKNGSTILHAATYNGHAEILLLLLEKGGKINAVDNNGTGILHTAAAKGHKAALILALKRGGNINAIDNNGSSLLHLAAFNGHLEILKYLLENLCDANALDSNGSTPLHLAAFNGHQEILKLLMEKNCDINLADKSGSTPLHAAAFNGQRETLVLLLQKGGDINAVDNNAFTLLHVAAFNNHREIILLLLEKGSNINVVDQNGFSILHAAVFKGHKEIVLLLLEKGFNLNEVNKYGRALLHVAASENHIEILTLLLKNGCNVNSVDDRKATPLHAAAFNGYLEALKLLLDKGANINAVDKNGSTISHLAVSNGHKGILTALLAKGIDINSANNNGISLLHAAVLNGHNELLTMLLEKGAKINSIDKNGFSILHAAAFQGNLNALTLLLEKGAEINVVDNNGSTLLHAAALNGNNEILKFLFKKGASINATDKDGSTLLHAAASKRQIATLELLLKNNANINAINNDGSGILHAAIFNGHLETLKFLLKFSTKINISDKNNSSLLHAAALKGHQEIAKILLEKGIEIDALDKHRMTPLHISALKGHHDLVKLLLDNKSNINAIDQNGSTPLNLAAAEDHREIAIELIKRGSNLIDKNKSTVLHAVAAKGHKNLLEILLKEKIININAKDANEMTPLHVAAFNGHCEILKILLENQADLKAVDINGCSLLHLASFNGHLEIVNFLLNIGCNVNAVDCNGSTVLHAAAFNQHSATLQLLVEKGGDVNGVDGNGSTLLHGAAFNGDLDLVSFLVEKGANVNAVDVAGFTPLFVAASSGHRELALSLVDKGGLLHF